MEHFVVFHKDVGGRIHDTYFKNWQNARRYMLHDIAADGYGIYNQTNCAFIMGVNEWCYSWDTMSYSIETSDYGEQ